MKKVLFIIQSYPSEKSANVLCDERVMKELINTSEFEVHCLCYRYANQPLEEVINGIHVHRWNRGLWWKIFSRAEYREMKNGTIIIKINRFFMRLKQVLFIPLFPVYEPILAIQLKKQTLKLYEKIPFDVVLAEHNGLDTVYAGWKLKQKKKTVFIPVFWDSLSGGFRPKYLPSKYVDNRKAELEEKIIRACDCAIMMQSHKKHILKLYEDKQELLNKITFLDIPYLDIIKEIPKKVFNNDKINIVFAGNMSMRNPTFFFKVVNASESSNILVHFFTDSKDHARIMRLAKEYNVSIDLHDYIPHSQLRNYLADADILLNFGVDNPNAISGKIFEYIGFKKPIISTYSIDNESVIPVLNKYPISLLIDERKEPKYYNQSISKLLSDYSKKTIDTETLQQLFKNNMSKTYVEKIKESLKMREV